MNQHRGIFDWIFLGFAVFLILTGGGCSTLKGLKRQNAGTMDMSKGLKRQNTGTMNMSKGLKRQNTGRP